MKPNISRLFLLPGIQIEEKTKKLFAQFGFVNTFLSCAQLSYSFNVIFLLFKPSEFDMGFYTFARNMEKNPNFIETIDLGQNQVAMIYRIPRRFTKDYELFLDGQYSKLSKEFQSCFAMEDFKRDSNGRPIIDAGRYLKEPSRFYHVFNRTEWLKDRWKLKLYGHEDKDGNVILSPKDRHEAAILDDVELFDKQDPELETLLLEFELWR